MSAGPLRIGLLGCGTVGAAVVRLLDEHRDDVARRAGRPLEVVRVAVRDLTRDRGLGLDAAEMTADPMAVATADDVDIVCELMGGIEPARELVLAALKSGHPVVTANKELVATHGEDLFHAADAAGRDLFFEAAVGGGIPLIRPLKESLAGERVTRVLGIVNGTTNYILTRMTEEGMGFADALKAAQDLGYAEADPTADVGGHDAASKCAILSSIAFNARVVSGDVHREGIEGLSSDDIATARRLGYVVKLLAIAEVDADGRIAARVHPAMIPSGHPLAAVREALNAVYVEGPNIGELMFSGRGAGGAATATAVIGDLVAAARNLSAGTHGVGCTCFHETRLRPFGEIDGQFAITLLVRDRPGALAEIAGVFGVHGISIKSAWQEGFDDDARLVFVTHRARESAFQSARAEIASLPSVRELRSVLRVVADE